MAEEHVHTYDWKSELEAMREDARHFYLDHFDWKGHGPPPGFDGPRYYPPAEEWRLVAQLDRSVQGAGDQVNAGDVHREASRDGRRR